MPSVRELVSFHRIERQIYARLLALSIPLIPARNIVSLWIYLQFIGIDLLNYISDCRDDSVVLRFISEAQSILHCIRTIGNPPRDSNVIPLTASLATEQLNLRFFHFNKDAVARGIDYIINGIGEIVFNTSDLSHRDLDRVFVNRSRANPIDLRTLFVTTTSSHRSGLRKEDVLEFFRRRWGDCVEDVVIEQRGGEVDEAVYGRVLMKEEHLVEVVFENRNLLVMEIEGSIPIFVRKFAVN